MKHVALSLLVVPFTLVLVGCITQYGSDPITNAAAWGTHTLLVVDEGNFGKGNAELDCYDLDARKLSADVYASANGGAIGDNANGAIVKGDSLFVVVNNSDKIVLVSRSTATLIRTYPFAAGTSPYAMALASDSTIAVASFNTNAVLLLNIHTGNIDAQWSVGNNPQSITRIGTTLWVASPGFSGDPRVDVIDLARGTVARVTVGRNPVDVIPAAGGNVFVLCSGMYKTDSTADISGAVQLVDGITHTLLWSSDVSGHPFKMAAGNNRVFVPTGAGIASIDATMGTMLTSFGGSEAFYGITVDTVTGHVWTTDAKDFQQRADLVEFDGAGIEQTRVSVGVNPGTLVVEY